MSRLPFLALLDAANLSKRAFAQEVGYSAEQVSRWGEEPPEWVYRYLEMKIRENGYKSRILEYETLFNQLRDIVGEKI